jgi:biopolymer transport protein ExbD/biopolymer transport protein TolR
MAMSAVSKGSMNDINMTPMIDILLVLLVIFIIAQPMLQRSIDIQLPIEKDEEEQQDEGNAAVIVLEMTANGGYFLNTAPLSRANLVRRLTEVYAARPDKVLFVKAEGGVKYGAVVDAMDAARGAGVEVIGAVLPQGGQ